MSTTDLVAQINALKQKAAVTARMRAEAGSALGFAGTQLAQIDAELKDKLGINPEHAEQELAALEAQLAKTTVELDAQLDAEQRELERILALARQAQLVR